MVTLTIEHVMTYFLATAIVIVLSVTFLAVFLHEQLRRFRGELRRMKIETVMCVK